MLYPLSYTRGLHEPALALVAPTLAQLAMHAGKIGRGGPIRTGDRLLPKQERYQTALRPVH